MKLPGTYRHELKYPINTADCYALRQRISSFMKRDLHTGEDGLYTVRSIYFDNADDKALREKIYGVQKRENFGSATTTTTSRLSPWRRKSSTTICA